ncbi:hypothetical protein ACFODT_03560 [Vibrio zhugei]|uniref:Outer membrane protein beta-barrel domain-containing protein n=1 Tax=Vibrio zhugei TaxID=2479546 RepID=A0ABV7C4G1_9VIBR|nr:hypothetical protein [Vibrio zhugei]
MKKTLGICFVGVMCFATQAFAAPAYQESQSVKDNPHSLSAGIAIDQQLSAVLSVDNTYRFTIGNQGGAVDYIFKRGQFENLRAPLSWYVGAGAWSQWDHDEFGARLPVGVSYPVTKRLEMYAQVHPELDLHDDADLQLGGALGVKYHF